MSEEKTHLSFLLAKKPVGEKKTPPVIEPAKTVVDKIVGEFTKAKNNKKHK